MTAARLDTVDAVRAEVRRVDEHWPTQIHGLLAHYDRVAADVARSDARAVDLALVFLEADAVGFGTGYIAEELMHRLAHARLRDAHRRRAAAVVVHRVRRPRTRLLRPAARLAAGVWDDELAATLGSLASGEDAPLARRARWLVAHAEHCRRSWDGAAIATRQYPRGAGRGMGGTPSGH